MKVIWYLLALLLGGLALAGVQHIAHAPDTPTLVGDIAITVALLAGAWICLRRANRLTETGRGKASDSQPGT